HQPDPEGLSPWKGIGQMKLEVDFAVARPGQPPLPPVLAAGALPVGTTLAIQAMKAQSRATADMAATASIDAVPAVALQAALVDYAAPAQMRVSGSQAGEQYALWREAATGDVAGGSPQDGNGAALDFASGPLTADTVLVLTTTGKAAIPVSRRV